MRRILAGVAGGGGIAQVAATGVDLGSRAALQAAYGYSSVPNIAARALITRLHITATGSGLWDLVIRDAASDTGALLLEALDINGSSYDISAPWLYSAASGSALHIGIRNRASGARGFTLNTLRAERFA